MLLPIVIRIIEMSTSISKQTKQIHEHNSLHSVQLKEGGEQFGNLKIMKHFIKVPGRKIPFQPRADDVLQWRRTKGSRIESSICETRILQWLNYICMKLYRKENFTIGHHGSTSHTEIIVILQLDALGENDIIGRGWQIWINSYAITFKYRMIHVHLCNLFLTLQFSNEHF